MIPQNMAYSGHEPGRRRPRFAENTESEMGRFQMRRHVVLP
jgi:hypothetical protein